MLSKDPHALPSSDASLASDEPPVLEAPASLVERYLELQEQKRQIDDQLAYVRAELEMLAAAALTDHAPRARFVAGRGLVAARLYPTCSFDRSEVGQVLQRLGRLSDVATIQGPSLARFLAKEPQLKARLGHLVRHRRGVMLMAGRL